MADTLCLEPIGGIAGDMFLALAMDLGVPQVAIEEGLRSLGVSGWRFEVSRAQRHGIEGTHLDVKLEKAAHEHDHEHGHEHSHHRAWKDIRALIEKSALAPRVKERGLAVFQAVAEAEAKVHGKPVEEIAFHEVGAVDSIVDAIGAGLAIELLGSPEVYCAPPPMGSGIGRRAHGMMPIPPPATLQILTDRVVRFEGRGELTTPTGAAIAKALTKQGPFPEMTIERVGYGVGTSDFPDRPNVLRGILGRRASSAEGATCVLEANLDDATPQLLAHVVDRLLAAGALDAWIAPVTMKKGRPGHVLGALAPAALRAGLTELILRETPSLGVRVHPVERAVLERRFEEVETPWGPVKVKIGMLSSADVNATPEYEDCARLAREKDVPLKQVLAAALAALAGKSR
ncbi:MAG: nickel pincer cofactor biosynthesis protein LarC [Myxococcales bacterium]